MREGVWSIDGCQPPKYLCFPAPQLRLVTALIIQIGIDHHAKLQNLMCMLSQLRNHVLQILRHRNLCGSHDKMFGRKIIWHCFIHGILYALQGILRHQHKLHTVLLSQFLLLIIVILVSCRKLFALLQFLTANLVTMCCVGTVCEACPTGICPKFLFGCISCRH